MKYEQAEEAARAGATTTREFAEYLGLDRSHVSRELKKMAENGVLDRHPDPDGNGYIYSVPLENPDDDLDDLDVLGDRDYDWERYVPSLANIPEYQSVRGELEDIEAALNQRTDPDGPIPHFRLIGPPGTGKSLLARYLAAKRGWPLFEVQITAQMREADLLGSPHMIGGDTVWVDGPVVRGLLCSRERDALVLFDEVNRAPFRNKSALQPALDSRTSVTIKPRGNEEIRGQTDRFVTLATMNEGAEYKVFDLDPAERRRHHNTWPIPYTGLVEPEREIDLLVDQAPVDEDRAKMMVSIANDLRRKADSDGGTIQQGVPLPALVRWAKTARAYEDADRPDPWIRAARTALINPRYDRGDVLTPNDETGSLYATSSPARAVERLVTHYLGESDQQESVIDALRSGA